MPKSSIDPLAIHSARLGYAVIAIGVAWGFVYLFAALPREWRIAIGATIVIAGYLLFNGYRAHRSADRVDQPID